MDVVSLTWNWVSSLRGFYAERGSRADLGGPFQVLLSSSLWLWLGHMPLWLRASSEQGDACTEALRFYLARTFPSSGGGPQVYPETMGGDWQGADSPYAPANAGTGEVDGHVIALTPEPINIHYCKRWPQADCHTLTVTSPVSSTCSYSATEN